MMRMERAVELAQDALTRLLSEPEGAAAFLSETGLEIDELRARADDPAFLGLVLEYFASDEARAEAFCLDHQLTPERFMALRAKLPYGDAPHWI